MKTITLKEAHYTLSLATAVIIDEDAVVYPSLWELTGERDNEFLYLSWEHEGKDYSLKFNEADNLEAKIEGCCLFLYDTDANDDDDQTMLTILTPKQLD
jgi:hypothetical protein